MDALRIDCGIVGPYIHEEVHCVCAQRFRASNGLLQVYSNLVYSIFMSGKSYPGQSLQEWITVLVRLI